MAKNWQKWPFLGQKRGQKWPFLGGVISATNTNKKMAKNGVPKTDPQKIGHFLPKNAFFAKYPPIWGDFPVHLHVKKGSPGPPAGGGLLGHLYAFIWKFSSFSNKKHNKGLIMGPQFVLNAFAQLQMRIRTNSL